MKKLTAYYLILLYACSIAKPVSIWFADVLAHSYFGHQHIGVVHREDGKDHVHKQMNKAAEDDIPAQKNTTPKNNEDVTVAFFVKSPVCTDRLLKSEDFHFKAIALPSVYLSILFPPPRRFGA